jgi:DNA invertase Pin-like site-specific DNA recombinase
LAGRDEFKSLIESAKSRPRPFDRILVDDTSRLARNVADALNAVAILGFHGVGVTFVSQGIDSLSKSARQLLTLHGMVDEQFLEGLRDKVHRGQEGRVLHGMTPGGRCYGYVNVPIEDANRQGKYGRPAVLGVELRIHPEQAAAVRRIFQMYADGLGSARISKILNAEGVSAPQPPRTRTLRAWCPSSIWEMLRNERFRGIHVWNRTRKVRNPETGRKISKARPQEEWKRVEVPEWRIVSEELWNAVQARIGRGEKAAVARMGGMNRTEHARSYLFSGLLICGECGSRLVIISGRGKRGYVRYGCPSHRYRGVCANVLTIRQDRLEKQLLNALEQRLLNPQLMDYLLKRFQEELQQRLDQIERKSAGQEELGHERRRLQMQIERIADAIADTGHSPALLSKLADLENRIAELDRRAAADRPVNVSATVEEVKEFIQQNVMQLRNLLLQDPTRSKAALVRHLGQLVLKPVATPSGPVYEVSGSLDLLPGKDVMPLVARDGIPLHTTLQIPLTDLYLDPRT